MKFYFTSAIVLILASCSNEGNQLEATPESMTEESVTESESSATTVEILEETEKPQLKKKNQVNDYAEFFLGTKVVDAPDDLDYEHGLNHYYKLLDVANGYAEVTGAYEGEDHFAIWRMANGHDLVGYTSMGCGPVCSYEARFYEIDGDESTEVTETILPWNELNAHAEKIKTKVIESFGELEYDDTEYIFQLPQKGTSMEVYISLSANDFEFPIVLLSWDKTKFSISKKYEKIPEPNS